MMWGEWPHLSVFPTASTEMNNDSHPNEHIYQKNVGNVIPNPSFPMPFSGIPFHHVKGGMEGMGGYNYQSDIFSLQMSRCRLNREVCLSMHKKTQRLQILGSRQPVDSPSKENIRTGCSDWGCWAETPSNQMGKYTFELHLTPDLWQALEVSGRQRSQGKGSAAQGDVHWGIWCKRNTNLLQCGCTPPRSCHTLPSDVMGSMWKRQMGLLHKTYDAHPK